MSGYYYSLLALDVARERTREAEERRLIHALENARAPRRSTIRRLSARVLAGVSRATAAGAHRLDTRIGDELRRSAVPAK